MNENFNNQMPNVNPQPVQPMAPQAPMAPVQPVQPVAPQAPMAPVQPVQPMAPQAPMAPVAPVAPAQPMDKKAIMKWVAFGCGIAMVLSPILPWVSVFGMSANLFDGDSTIAVVFMLLGALAAATHILGKAKRYALVSGGGAFIYTLFMLLEGAEGASIGFWLMFLASLGIIVVDIIENVDEFKTIVGPKSPVVPATSAAPMVAPVAPTVQAAVVCANCGQPKKNPADQFCQSCGQRY